MKEKIEEIEKIKEQMKFQIETSPERGKVWLESINKKYIEGTIPRDWFEELYDECIKLMNTNPSTQNNK